MDGDPLNLLRKFYYAGLWLVYNKMGALQEDASTIEPPPKVPDYEYETLARSFLSFVLEYFSKEENVKDFEEWKANRQRRKTGIDNHPDTCYNKPR